MSERYLNLPSLRLIGRLQEFASSIRADLRQDAARLDFRRDLPLSRLNTRLGIKVSELARLDEF